MGKKTIKDYLRPLGRKANKKTLEANAEKVRRPLVVALEEKQLAHNETKANLSSLNKRYEETRNNLESLEINHNELINKVDDQDYKIRSLEAANKEANNKIKEMRAISWCCLLVVLGFFFTIIFSTSEILMPIWTVPLTCVLTGFSLIAIFKQLL